MPDVAADQVWSVLLAGVETRGCSAVFAVTKRLKVKQDACSNCSGSRSASRHAAASRNPQTRRSASSRKVCRYPSAHREFMARHAVELVDADLYYRNPKSKWCSSPLIVNKADGDFRMAVDVRLSMPNAAGIVTDANVGSNPRLPARIQVTFPTGFLQVCRQLKLHELRQAFSLF